jgi:hypothetical protein
MKKSSFIKGALGILLFLTVALSIITVTRSRLLRPDLFIKERFQIGNLVMHFPFSSEHCLKEWEEKILKGKVVYLIEQDRAQSFVRAKSERTASALYYKIKLDITKRPLISWKWHVNEFPVRKNPESIEDIKEEDFAARVYVIFPALFFTNSKVIEYIWSQTLPEGTIGTSGYSKNIRVLVLKTGESDGWQHEERDIVEDYIRLFGEQPRLNVGSIAFMTDADSTKTSADAVYDEMKVGYK